MRAPTTAAVTATATATALLGTGAAAVAAGRRAARRALGPDDGPAVPAGFRHHRMTVRDRSGDRITLDPPPDPRTRAMLATGRYALRGERGGHAALGPPVGLPGGPPAPPAAADGEGAVLRTLLRPTGPPLIPGERVWLTPQLYTGDPGTALDLPYAEVAIPSELGPLPGWFLPGSRKLWVIALHGLGATREQPLNLLPLLHRNEFPTLIPAYRGDPGAPAAPDGLNRLGATEWRDADAALRYAVRYGARRVLLLGWSVGATMALRAAADSPLRNWIAGLVLDSPVLDWSATVRAVAAERGVPGPLLPLAAGAAAGGARLGPAVSSRAPTRPAGAPLPVLLVHGPGDPIAPWAASRSLAARHPEGVVLHEVPGAGHAAMWNAGPRDYEETLRRFATPLT